MEGEKKLKHTNLGWTTSFDHLQVGRRQIPKSTDSLRFQSVDFFDKPQGEIKLVTVDTEAVNADPEITSTVAKKAKVVSGQPNSRNLSPAQSTSSALKTEVAINHSPLLHKPVVVEKWGRN